MSDQALQEFEKIEEKELKPRKSVQSLKSHPLNTLHQIFAESGTLAKYEIN